VLPYLGEIAVELGEMPLAEELLTQALRKFPDGELSRDARFHLARAKAAQGRTAEAETLLRNLADEPENTLADQAQYQLGLVLYQANRDDEARQAWASLLNRNPEGTLRARAALGVAWVLYRQQKFAEARETLASLLDDPQFGTE